MKYIQTKLTMIIDGQRELEFAAANNMIISIKLMIREKVDWKYALLGACKSGNLMIAKMAAKKCKLLYVDDIMQVFQTACKYGNETIIVYLISIYPNDMHFWNAGLYGACEGGHLHLVLQIMTKLPDDYESAFEYACKGGNMDIIELISEYKGVKYNRTCLEFGLRYACQEGQIEVAKWLIGKGIIPKLADLYQACLGGNIECVKYIKPQTQYDQIDWNNIWNNMLNCACYSGNIELIEYIIKQFPTDSPIIDWNQGLHGACEGGHLPVVKMMVERGANDWNEALIIATECQNNHLIDFLIAKGANNWNIVLGSACMCENWKIVRMMIQKGAKKCNNCKKSPASHMKTLQKLIVK